MQKKPKVSPKKAVTPKGNAQRVGASRRASRARKK